MLSIFLFSPDSIQQAEMGAAMDALEKCEQLLIPNISLTQLTVFIFFTLQKKSIIILKFI